MILIKYRQQKIAMKVMSVYFKTLRAMALNRAKKGGFSAPAVVANSSTLLTSLPAT
jgi:hypothetical protein